MRGTTNEQAYDAFFEGSRGFPVLSDEGFAASVRLLKRALELEPGYPRPRGWLAYAYVLSVTEGWRFGAGEPEAGWSEKRRLDAAEKLAREAVALDETDYDTHWALANVLVNTSRWDEAICSFDRARYLGRSENNPSLLVDMADALVHAGDVDRALAMIRHARRVPDWHRWVAAWALYAKGRSDPAFYDFALEELRHLYWQPGEDHFIADVKLLEAAIHAQRAGSAGARKGGGGGARAATALQAFRERPELARWTVETARRFAPFRDPEDLEHWLEGCRAAGLADQADAAGSDESH